LLEARLKKHGGRGDVQLLRLLETFAIDEVTHAIEDALEFGKFGFDAVKYLEQLVEAQGEQSLSRMLDRWSNWGTDLYQ
jgi:hypothetical protein